jgi:tetratricopeptide (TPR) repeat protein
MRNRFLVPFLLLCAAAALIAEPQVGAITSISGRVQIDAFGKGVFIKAITGDILYAASVIRTDPDARAVIDVQGKTQEIPPGATVAVQDLLSSAQKKGSWFTALTGLIKSFSSASRKGNEEVVAGSRATEVGSQPEDEWMVEESGAEEALTQARGDIGKGDWSAALARLAKAEPATDPSVSWDVAFWKGYCFYQMGDYRDAADALSPAYDALASAQAAPVSSAQRRILLFQLGSSWFFLGQEKRAVPLFDSLVADRVDDDSQPYAYLLLARSLAASGDAVRARSVAQEALKKYRGTALEQELAALAR